MRGLSRGLMKCLIPVALPLLVSCGTGEKSLRTPGWQTVEMATPRLRFQLSRGEDAWGIHWNAKQPRAYLYHSDYLGDRKCAFQVDLQTMEWKELPYEVAYSCDFSTTLVHTPALKLNDLASPVEVRAEGEAASGLTHFRWGFTRKGRPNWMWFHFEREATFTGELVVKERATGLTLVRQRLVSAFPERPWEERLSLSPDGRYLAYIDGGVGMANHLYLFELSTGRVVHPADRKAHT